MEWLREDNARRQQEERDAAEAKLRAQPRAAVTLSDLNGGRPLPTLRAAAAIVRQYAGTVHNESGELRVVTPVSFAGRNDALDACRVLFAAQATVLTELAKKTPDLDALPDVQVLPGGGLAP